MKNLHVRRSRYQRGATAVFLALTMVALLGIAALAVDVGYLYVIRGELQNAADAGALAGAQVLYINDGQQVNPGANSTAATYVNANFSEKMPVTVEVVQRGHWSFATRQFTVNEDTLEPVDLWRSTEELDADPNFINAVRVVTTRKGFGNSDETPEEPFFSRILGIGPRPVSAEAIAYIGFAGTLRPADVDQPIVVCANSITTTVDGGGRRYTCGVGRMAAGGETAAWTDFIQPANNRCSGGTNAPGVAGVLGSPPACSTGNTHPIVLGRLMNLINGQLSGPGFSTFWDCWWAQSNGGTRPWQMTLPVVECNPDGTVNPCEDVVGAVTVNVIWVNDNANTNPARWSEAPTNTPSTRPGGAPLRMEGFGEGEGRYEPWQSDLTVSGEERWRQFAEHFRLQIPPGPDGWTHKTIYFVPDCSPHEPRGTTGGENFGILAKIPVLVR